VTRVYVPASWELLAALTSGPVHLPAGRAVTETVRRELAGSDEEELEYAALQAAAADALGLVVPERPRRVVLAVDADVSAGDISEVTLRSDVALADVAAVHVDGPDAVDDVAAAAAAPDDESLVDRALDHDLGWYAVQELPDLLAE
jgi:hypothetical protein